jgi:UDP-4-amino-4,6-dideoxy-N-acetyl-beta-L-altrosamine transaminase
MAKFEEYLPYVRHAIDETDIAAVAETLRSPWLTTGPAVTDFEAKLATLTECKYAIAVSSATAALHLTAIASGLDENCCAIVPTITFVATANAVRYCGAKVIFADVDPLTGLMGPKQFEEALFRAKKLDLAPKVVFLVHLAGQCADLEALYKIAFREEINVIEDAAHAIGTKYTDSHNQIFTVGCCEHSTMTVFSFHPAKTIAMGEGGAITTNDPELANKLRLLRSHGITKSRDDFIGDTFGQDENTLNGPWYYEMQSLGFNYRASDINCALGASQLKKLEKFKEHRQKAVEHYARQLEPLKPFVFPLEGITNNLVCWHVFVALFDFAKIGISRSELMNKLHEENIGSQVLYIPVHRQPYYQEIDPELILEGAEQYYESCLCLPLSSSISPTDIQQIVNTLKSILII